MKKFKDYILVALKGAGMGGADVIPGVSGGTIAFMTGIYEELIESINSVNTTAVKLLFTGRFKEFWKHINGNFLVAVFAGIFVSILSLANIMQYLLANHPIQTWAFFFGLIVASSIFILRDIKGWSIKEAVFLAVGVTLGVTVCTLSPTNTPDDLWFIFISGAIAICAMILPGISGSFILLILGKYEYILGTIANITSGEFGHNLAVIGVFGIGAVCGILAFSKFLHWLLGKYHKQTIIVLAGFIIGSLVKVWPWSNMEAIVCSQFPRINSMAEALGSNPLPTELIEAYSSQVDMHIGGAILFAIIGFCLVTTLELLAKKIK